MRHSKGLLFIILFSLAISLYANEVDFTLGQFLVSFVDEAKAEVSLKNNDAEDYKSYINLEHWQKSAIYWSLKGLSWSLSTLYFVGELVYPITKVNPFDTEGEGYLWPLFKPWCHHLPSRTFFYPNGRPMPLCARCTGINVGVFLGHFDSFIWDSFQIKNLKRYEQGLLHIGLYSLLTLPMIVDGAVQYTTDYQSTNGWRLASGMLFGYALTAIADEIIELILDYSGDVHPDGSRWKTKKLR